MMSKDTRFSNPFEWLSRKRVSKNHFFSRHVYTQEVCFGNALHHLLFAWHPSFWCLWRHSKKRHDDRISCISSGINDVLSCMTSISNDQRSSWQDKDSCLERETIRCENRGKITRFRSVSHSWEHIFFSFKNSQDYVVSFRIKRCWVYSCPCLLYSSLSIRQESWCSIRD